MRWTSGRWATLKKRPGLHARPAALLVAHLRRVAPGTHFGLGLVGSYFEKYPDELPTWDAFTDAATESNTLEALGISGAVGVPAPERPQELGRQFTYSGAPGEGGE